MQAAILVGQHRDGRVVAHAADGFLPVLDHRVQDNLQLLHGGADGKLAAAQRLALCTATGSGASVFTMWSICARPAGPFTEGLAAGQHVLHIASSS